MLFRDCPVKAYVKKKERKEKEGYQMYNKDIILG